MATHSFGTLESAYAVMQLHVLYTRAPRVLFGCCVGQRPAGKCHKRLIRKFCSIWDMHRTAVSVLLNVTRINYALWDWRFLQQCCLRLRSSGTWRCVIVLCLQGHTFQPSWTAWLWNVWHSVTSQKTWVFWDVTLYGPNKLISFSGLLFDITRESRCYVV
jgi:hypothetical protein